MIVELFPTETSETWYSPSRKSSAPSGKLYSKYNNYKSQLDEVGIIQRTKRAPVIEATTIPIEFESDQHYDDPMAVIKVTEFEDLKEFSDCWMLMFDERRKILRNQGVKLYMDTFPYLKTDSGYEMVN